MRFIHCLSVFLACLTPVPALAQEEDSLDATIALMDAEVDNLLAKSMKPSGAPDASWSSNAVDLDALLAANPGMVLATIEKDARAVYLRDNEIDRHLPSDWHRVKTSGTGTATGTSGATVLMAFTSDHAIAATGSSRRVGKGECSIPGAVIELIHFERQGAEERANADLGAGMMFFLDRYLSRLNEIEICSVLRNRGPGKYRFHYYTPDGRRLPEMSSDEADATLIPIDQIAAVLTKAD